MSEIPPAAPRQLPRGRHRLSRREVWESQRGRLLDSIAESVAALGYGAVTVDEVVRRAGVSKSTFYEHFTDKEACYLAAFELATTVLAEEMTEAAARARSPEGRLRAAGRAMLETVAHEPAYARAFLVEVFGSSPGALRHRSAAVASFAALFEQLHGKPSEPRMATVLVAGTLELLADLVRRDEVRRAPELEPVLASLARRLLGPA